MAASRALRLALALLLPSAAPVGPQHAPPPQSPKVPPTFPLGEASLDDTLQIDGERIAGETVDTRMMVDVRIDGSGPYRFLVDSGADRSAVGAGLAAALKLPPGLAVTLHGVAGASRRETVRIEALTVGGSTVPDIVAPLLEERYLGARGLLGIDALRGQRLMLDFEAQAITIQDTRVPVKASGDEIVVTARRRGGQLILTQARAGGVGIRAVVDTGSQITVGNLALRDVLFRRGRMPPTSVPATIVSVTGETIVVPLAIVPELRIGGIVMRQVPVAFGDLAPFTVFGLAETPAMLLGTDLMGQFRRVSLDFGAKKVRFQLRRCGTRAGEGVRMRQEGGPVSGCPRS